MKKLTIDFLWYCLNKLDPISFEKISISDEGVVVKFKKNFIRKNRWEHVVVTIHAWLMKNEEVKQIAEVGVFKNGGLDHTTLLSNLKMGTIYPEVSKKKKKK